MAMRQDYSPDPLWSMAAMPGETHRGWANRQTKAAYDYLVADPVRARAAVELAASCLAAGRSWTQQRRGSASIDGQDQHAFAASELSRRLDLGPLPSTVRVRVDFGQILDACLEQG